RCVLELTPDGLLVTEIAPGIDPERDILAQSDAPLRLADDLKLMNPLYFQQGSHHE
ncbi:acyl CoA:acetate/3-ketoacid CoA transferase, partial [Escherichia coli]|nr:acyl CoA:acetate/3-ketoacid CoA transferase [Escherichia coli]